MRPPFVGHRRYSITHRAVQRLRELVPTRQEDDDETLRDRLDEALGAAEDGGQAIRTLDAMLGEPQTLIPVREFGEVLYAIIKEDTVVTVLPKGHGEEILQRGQAMEQRVASGQVQVRPTERDRDEKRFEAPRRRWQKDGPPVVIERVGRPSPPIDPVRSPGESLPPLREEVEAPLEAAAAAELSAPADNDASGLVFRLPERPTVDSPVATALSDALDRGRRRAAILALRDALQAGDPTDALLPLWNAMAQQGIPQTMTIGDLIEAAAGSGR